MTITPISSPDDLSYSTQPQFLLHHATTNLHFSNTVTALDSQTSHHNHQFPSGQNNYTLSGNHIADSSNMMTSQATSHHHDQLHNDHISNAGSSLESHHSQFDLPQYSQPNFGSTNSYAVPVSYTGSRPTDTSFGGVPVSADAFHQYPPQHQRSSSTSSASSPYTEPTSVSESNSPGGAPAPGGGKAPQVQMMLRARSHASPYNYRPDQPPWNGSYRNSKSSHLMRSHSVFSDVPSNTEDEIFQLLRSQSRENSVSDWNLSSQMTPESTGPLIDPYPTTRNASVFGNRCVSDGSMTGGLVGVSHTMGGAGTQMKRMNLDSTETYEALAHHIRTVVTTSASDRARQAFVQAWLNSSYISYPDGNVSRQGLYGSYLRICQQYDIKPINSASFGKSVRQSFPNIKTRRLGVRGNSKYHYCGIRPSTAKEAEILMQLSKHEKPEPGNTSRDEVDSDESSSRRVSFQTEWTPDENDQVLMSPDAQWPETPKTTRPNFESLMTLPNLEELLSQHMAHEIDHQKARVFWSMYVEHAQSLLESVKSYRFDQFELTIRTFWSNLDSNVRECVTHSTMMSLIHRADAVIYDEILDYLHSQTLRQMLQQDFGSLRQLAQNMEQVIIAALASYPNHFVGPKIELAARFGHLVIRNLGICQLAQALSGIFSNPNNLKEMAEAWDGIDFEAVRNQAALVTNCQREVLSPCFEDFRAILKNPNANINHFITFVESTSERCLQPTSDNERGLTPRSLLVRWCFVSSQLMRDLTLRSASSFGSFQIVNLFFDEWLGFKVLRKVALHVTAVAASVDPTPSFQLQSMSSANDSSANENSINFVGFTPHDFDANQDSTTESSHAGGLTPTIDNLGFGKDCTSETFLFGSNSHVSDLTSNSFYDNSNHDMLSEQAEDPFPSTEQKPSEIDSPIKPKAFLNGADNQLELDGGEQQLERSPS